MFTVTITNPNGRKTGTETEKNSLTLQQALNFTIYLIATNFYVDVVSEITGEVVMSFNKNGIYISDSIKYCI